MDRTRAVAAEHRAAVPLGGLARSSWYYEPAGETAENLALMRRIDEQYLETPFYGSRKMAETWASIASACSG